jgi:hypothetical protein
VSSNSAPIFRVLEFVILRILDRDKGVFGVYILDVAAIERRAAKQTRVIKADDIGGLVSTIRKLQQGSARIETQIDAPMLITVAEERVRMPANREVTSSSKTRQR